MFKFLKVCMEYYMMSRFDMSYHCKCTSQFYGVRILLDSIEAYATPYTLEPGQSAPFSLDVGPPTAPIDEIDHVKYHLTWTSPSNIIR